MRRTAAGENARLTHIQLVRMRGRYIVVHDDIPRNRWIAYRIAGIAFGPTPDEAAAQTFADGGQPAEAFPSLAEAAAYARMTQHMESDRT